MSLRQSIINDKLDEYIQVSGDAPDVAFMKLANAIITDCDYDDLQPEDVVDGGEDKQIDVLSLEEDSVTGIADVLILQTKNTDSFSSTALTLLGNGLSWVFEKSKAQYQNLNNVPLVRKIDVVREFRTRSGPSNLRTRVFFVTKGNTHSLSKEFIDEMNEIRAKYEAGGFGHFEISALGSSELVAILAEQERRLREINDTLPIVYDRHKPSFIRYSSHGMSGYICTVKGSEVARLVGGDRDKAIFDLNLRRFYGAEKGRVNPSIAATSSNRNESHMFWFFNNGITIVCDRCQVVDDPDNAHLKLTNLQIVNGCQTSMTLAAIAQQGTLQDDVEVLAKIFETSDEKFVSRVVLTTNNQNAISSRDLKANDQIQEDYQRAFSQLYGLRYERKPREFKGLSREESKTVVSNEKIAQAYLAIVKKKPTIARTQKYRIWDDEWYQQIFPEVRIEKHVLAYSIYDYCLKAKRESLARWQDDPIRYSVVSYGVFHLARVLAFRYTGKEDWNAPNETKAWIAELLKNPGMLNRHYKSSVTLLYGLIKKKPAWMENINNVFKANDIEGAINKALHVREGRAK
jgi:hypothetical protein